MRWKRYAVAIRIHEQIIVLNDQGGAVMDISDHVTMTLRAQEHGHQPIVCYPNNPPEIEAAGFNGKASATAGNIGFIRGVPDIGSRTGSTRCLLPSGKRR